MTRSSSRGAAGVVPLMVLGLLALGWGVAEAQSGSRSDGSAAWTQVRTPWGDPDFQGTWTTDDTIGVPVERPPALGNKLFLTDEDLAEPARQQQAARRAAAAAAAAGGIDLLQSVPPTTGVRVPLCPFARPRSWSILSTAGSLR